MSVEVAAPATTTTSITPHLACQKAGEAIEFYQKAFGAKPEMVMPMPDGRIMHASLNINGARVMVVDEFPEWGGKCPQTLGGTPVTIHLQVPDSDATFAQAVDAGCTVRMPLDDMFWGDRYGIVVDPYGHQWSIATPKRQVSVEELQKMASSFSEGDGGCPGA